MDAHRITEKTMQPY